MDEGLFARAVKKRVVEEAWECEFDDMEDSFSLIEDEEANAALWAGLEKKTKTKFVKRGRARDDPEKCAAYLAAHRERYRRNTELSGYAGAARTVGGHGGLPSYEGRAAYFHIHPGLMGVSRLILLTRLAVHGTATAPCLGHWMGLSECSARSQLVGLRGTKLVSCEPGTQKPRFAAKAAMLWKITEDGRKWLWRAGWVTSRVLFLDYPRNPLRNDVNHCPVRALKRHARVEFLRPAALAMAYELRGMGPCHAQHLTRFTGLREAHIHYMLTQWRAAGWVEVAGVKPARPRYSKASRLFRFTKAGELVLARHVDALRRAARAAGHLPTDYDIAFSGLYEDEAG